MTGFRQLRRAAVAAVLVLAACGDAEPADDAGDAAASGVVVSTAELVCGDEPLTAEFLEGDRVRVAIAGESLLMDHVPAASGAKYQLGEDTSTFFWTRGDNALASIRGDAYPECGPPDAEVVLVARGNEPGWRLDLTDDSLILVSDYGESRVEAATPVPEITGADRRYAVATDAGELVISIADRLCADDATGMPHPYQVVIEKDGQTLRGCGGDPESLLEGDEWVVEDIVGQRVIEAAPPTILFEDGGVSGSTSCNRFSASYELTGEGLTVGLTAVTERACEDALMAQEDRFLEILRDLYRFSITPDGALVLHTADERTVTARR